ncbi:MAG: AAA family ATPase [Rhodospirillales bacterium]|nr:AAA family ATPase [Rhodospirillales bacterium]
MLSDLKADVRQDCFAAFQPTDDPKLCYFDAPRRHAAARLLSGMYEGGGLYLLIGEAGAGKTILLQHLAAQVRSLDRVLPLSSTAVVPCRPGLTLAGLFASCARALGEIESDASPLKVTRHLQQLAENDRVPVLLIDDADGLDDEALDGLTTLTGLEVSGRRFLSVVLSARPSLLARAPIASCKPGGIATDTKADDWRIFLQPMSEADVGRLISHRLRACDVLPPAAFDGDAIAAIARESRGIPGGVIDACRRMLGHPHASSDRADGKTDETTALLCVDGTSQTRDTVVPGRVWRTAAPGPATASRAQSSSRVVSNELPPPSRAEQPAAEEPSPVRPLRPTPPQAASVSASGPHTPVPPVSPPVSSAVSPQPSARERPLPAAGVAQPARLRMPADIQARSARPKPRRRRFGGLALAGGGILAAVTASALILSQRTGTKDQLPVSASSGPSRSAWEDHNGTPLPDPSAPDASGTNLSASGAVRAGQGSGPWVSSDLGTGGRFGGTPPDADAFTPGKTEEARHPETVVTGGAPASAEWPEQTAHNNPALGTAPKAAISATPPPPPRAERPTHASASPAPASTPPSTTGRRRHEADALLRNGDEELDAGNVDDARAAYIEAFDKGNTEGAMKVARTFDPRFVKPGSGTRSPAEAILWYQDAARRGDRQAKDEIDGLATWLGNAASSGDAEARRVLNAWHQGTEEQGADSEGQ